MQISFPPKECRVPALVICSPFTRRQAAPLVHEEQNGHSIPARDRSNEYSGICEAFPAAQPRPDDEQGARRDIGEVQIQKRGMPILVERCRSARDSKILRSEKLRVGKEG